MFKFNFINSLNLITKLNLINQNQNRNFKRLTINKRKNLKENKKIKLLNLNHLNVVLNRRLRRTQLDCAIANRIYFRFEVFKERENYPFLKMSNLIINMVKEKAFKKYHNLMYLDEKYTDKLIEIYGNRETMIYYKKFNAAAEMNEIKFLINKTGKTAEQLIKKGILFDENGCPKYGKFNNTLILTTKRPQLHKANYYNLLDTKINSPKFCFDFYPCNQSMYSQRFMMMFFLKKIFKRNLIKRKPFNIYLTNYKQDYDRQLESFFKDLIVDDTILPSFIDFRENFIGDDLLVNDQKLIIITRNSNKQIYYDDNANYILPLFTNINSINLKSQKYYLNEFKYRPNIEFVSVPFNDYIDYDSIFNYAFDYYVLDSLKDGLNMKDSMQNAFYNFNKNNLIFNDFANEKSVFKSSSSYQSSNNNNSNQDFIYQEPLKKMSFKHFDNLEKELT